MWSWHSIPFVRLCLALILGILIYEGWPAKAYPFALGGFVASVIAMGCFHLFTAFKTLFTHVSLFALICMGYVLSSFHQPKGTASVFSNGSFESDVLIWVHESAHTQTGKQRWIVELVAALDPDGKANRGKGKFLLYSDWTDELPSYGETFLLRGIKVDEIKAPSHAYAFDYKSYMKRKGVLHRAYVKEQQIKKLPEQHGSWLLRKTHLIRSNALKILDQYLSDSEEKAVAAALLLGDKSILPEDLKDNYKMSGATHVLAVSGLHTGIVAGALMMFFNWLGRNNKMMRIVKFLLSMAGLWLFVCITGMSPSVLRAAVMFSFVLAAKLLVKRHVNTYNVIAISAFILLVFDTKTLYHVGFQLSYSALLGIIAFQDRIFRSIYIPNKWLASVWSLMTVSIAAQLGTLPLTIYYFHMFPFYFWLSGLIVVPLAGVILKLGMLTFATAAFSTHIGLLPAFLLSKTIWLMNTGIKLCSRLPSVEMEGLWITETEAILLGLSIIFAAIAWQLYRYVFIKYALICLCAALLLSTIISCQKALQKELYVYPNEKIWLADFFDGSNCYCIQTDMMDSIEIIKKTQLARWAHGSKSCSTLLWDGQTHINTPSVNIRGDTLQLINGQVFVKDMNLISSAVSQYRFQKGKWIEVEDVNINSFMKSQ